MKKDFSFKEISTVTMRNQQKAMIGIERKNGIEQVRITGLEPDLVFRLSFLRDLVKLVTSAFNEHDEENDGKNKEKSKEKEDKFVLDEYRGFRASVYFDKKHKIYVGEVFGTEDSLNFCGHSKEELNEQFHRLLDNYLDKAYLNI